MENEKVKALDVGERGLNESVRLVIAAVVAGVGAGALTDALKITMDALSRWLTAGFAASHGNWGFIVLPFIGIFGAILWQRLVGQNLAHATGQLRTHAHGGGSPLAASKIFTPLVGCLITVGFGGSAGAEGPSAFSGAALGESLGRRLRLSPASLRILFGAGAAAGIAGIFKSPVGGVLFTFEILGMGFEALGFAAVVASALTAFCTAYALSGFTWDLPLLHPQIYVPENIGWIVLLGLFCGVYCVYYRTTQNIAANFFTGLKRKWVGAVICSLALGVSIYFLPILYGEGYDTVSELVNGFDSTLLHFSPFSMLEREAANGWMVLAGVAVVLLLKGFAVGGTNSAGGVAGEFAPTIFAGALCGFLFATCINQWCSTALPVDTFALIGGAAVMAGAIKAPLMAIFIGAEISNRYNLILPFILVCGMAWLVVYLWEARRSNFLKSEK